MTAIEAINVLKNYWPDSTEPILEEAMSLAVEALEFVQDITKTNKELH